MFCSEMFGRKKILKKFKKNVDMTIQDGIIINVLS